MLGLFTNYVLYLYKYKFLNVSYNTLVSIPWC